MLAVINCGFAGGDSYRKLANRLAKRAGDED